MFYYTLKGYTISLPVTESTPYDLLVDTGECILRVQCKTTFYKNVYGIAVIELRSKGGSAGNNREFKRVDKQQADVLWACVEGKEAYEIPVEKIEGKGNINLGKMYVQYKVYASLAQMVERPPEKGKVVGSLPT